MKTLVFFSLILTVALGMPAPLSDVFSIPEKGSRSQEIGKLHYVQPLVKLEDKNQLKAPEGVKDQVEVVVKQVVNVEENGDEETKEEEEEKQDIKPQLGEKVEPENGDSGTEFFFMPEPELNIEPEEVKKELKLEDIVMFKDKLRDDLRLQMQVLSGKEKDPDMNDEALKKFKSLVAMRHLIMPKKETESIMRAKREAKEQPLKVFIPDPEHVEERPQLDFMDELLKPLEEIFSNMKKRLKYKLNAKGLGNEGVRVPAKFPDRKWE